MNPLCPETTNSVCAKVGWNWLSCSWVYYKLITISLKWYNMYVHVTLFWEGLGSSFKRESQAWISLTQCQFLPSLVEMSPCSGSKNKTKCRQCILALSVLSPLHVWEGRAGFFTVVFYTLELITLTQGFSWNLQSEPEKLAKNKK